MGKGVLGITAQVKDEATGPLARISEQFAKAQGAVTDANNKVVQSEREKKDALRKAREEMKRAQNAANDLREALSGATGAISHFAKKAGATPVQMVAIEASIGVVSTALTALKDLAIGAAHAFAELITKSANAGDEIFTLSERLGVSAEFLSEIGFAARLSGTELEAIEVVFRKLTKGITDGNPAFARWGITALDASGRTKDAQEVFEETADVIANLKSTLEQGAAAQDIFGKSGMQLIPLLRRGSQGLREMREEAARLGATIGSDFARSGDEFNDQLEATKTTLDAAGRAFAEAFLPVARDGLKEVEGLAIMLRDAIRDNRDGIKEFAEDMATVVKGVASGVAFMIENFGLLKEHITTAVLPAPLLVLEKAIQGARWVAGQFGETVEENTSKIDENSKAIAENAEVTRQAALEERRWEAEKRAGTEALEKLRAKANARRIRESVAAAKKEVDEEKRIREKASEGWDRLITRDLEAMGARRARENATREEQESKRAERLKKREEKAEEKRMKKMKDQIHDVSASVYSTLRNAFREASDAAGALLNVVESIGEKLLELAAMKGLEFLFGAATGGGSSVIGGLFSLLGFSRGGVVPQKFAHGGVARGPGTTDTVPAWLTPGELVIDPGTTRALKRALSVPTQAQGPSVQKFASGGVVQGASHGAPASVVINHSIQTMAPPNRAHEDRYVRDNLLPSLRRLHTMGALGFMRTS